MVSTDVVDKEANIIVEGSAHGGLRVLNGEALLLPTFLVEQTRKASTAPDSTCALGFEDEDFDGVVMAVVLGLSKVSLIGEDGREEEKKLVKLLDRRIGTKVFGLLDGESTPLTVVGGASIISKVG